jgi:hypothetical protein
MAKVLHIRVNSIDFGNSLTELQFNCDIKIKNDAGAEMNLSLDPAVIIRDAAGVVKTAAVLNQELVADVEAYLSANFSVSGFAAKTLSGGVVFTA